MVWQQFLQMLRLVAFAAHVGASGSESATWFRINRGGDLPFLDDPLSLRMDIHRRNRGEQRLGIWVQLLFKQLFRRCRLYQLA